LVLHCLHEKTREQQLSAIMDVSADWHVLVVLFHIMGPSVVHNSRLLDPWCSTIVIPPPQLAALGIHPVASKLLLINRSHRDGLLSWCWYTAAVGEI